MHGDLTFTVFLIFTGAAIVTTLALYLRQMMIVAYIAVGILLGPAGYGVVEDTERISQISHIGITFLLFLLGTDMSPVKLLKLLRSTTLITGISSVIFGTVGYTFGQIFGLNQIDSIILGVTLMFSSTIIGLKLLPTTVLHHKLTGEVIISILLLQDMLAIITLLLLQTFSAEPKMGHSVIWAATLTIVYLPLLISVAWLLHRFVIIKLMMRFDQLREYIFLLAIGWCLGIAELARYLGLSSEIGAFIAGIILAANPIALYITESLKPIRDFFLIIFFFSLGASVELDALQAAIVPAMILAAIILATKPYTLHKLVRIFGADKERSMEVGVRLGQGSEFSLLIATLALQLGIISAFASYLIQIVTLLTFIISPYFIVLKYPNPLALNDRLRRD